MLPGCSSQGFTSSAETAASSLPCCCASTDYAFLASEGQMVKCQGKGRVQSQIASLLGGHRSGQYLRQASMQCGVRSVSLTLSCWVAARGGLAAAPALDLLVARFVRSLAESPPRSLELPRGLTGGPVRASSNSCSSPALGLLQCTMPFPDLQSAMNNKM